MHFERYLCFVRESNAMYIQLYTTIRYSSMFAVLDVRNFASSQFNFSIPLLEVRNNIFASSQFLDSSTKSNVTKMLPKMLIWLFYHV